jgi:hypothetical protein
VTFARIRRIGRVFAALLLIWTAADLCDYSLCEHSRQPIDVAGSSDSVRQTLTCASVSPRTDAIPLCDCDDCFCCSRFVDVKIPFHISLLYTAAWLVEEAGLALPDLPPLPLYHPPLA